ncbi:TolC family protein [Mesorhizobium sp. M0983]|uniref:TolC family protein n=1 Tax=Mesorhizobium sp. M0983 TaxID=2957040 RepID=UPI00333CA18C
MGRNSDVLIAAANAYPARLQADRAAQALLPKVNGQVGGSDTSIHVSYEIDLWGKLAAKRDKADFEAYATAEDYDDARLVAREGAVEACFMIAYANQSLASVRASEDRLSFGHSEHQRGRCYPAIRGSWWALRAAVGD